MTSVQTIHRVRTNIGQAVLTGATALAVSAIAATGLLCFAALTEAGAEDLEDLIAILGMFAVANTFASSAALALVAVFLPAPTRWVAVIVGPSAVILGFLAVTWIRGFIDWLGVSGPNLNPFAVAAAASGVAAVTLYPASWRICRIFRSQHAA